MFKLVKETKYIIVKGAGARLKADFARQMMKAKR